MTTEKGNPAGVIACLGTVQGGVKNNTCAKEKKVPDDEPEVTVQL